MSETLEYITADELKFNTSDDWREWQLPENPEKGIVAAFCADRAPNWDQFVIIGNEEDQYKVIFPRIRNTPSISVIPTNVSFSNI